MQARMANPALLLPGAFQALGESAKKSGVSPTTALLVHLRASPINGCAYCVEMHSRELTQAGMRQPTTSRNRRSRP